jgi:hypothetical protein
MNISNDTSIQLDYASVSYLPTYSSLTNATIFINDGGTNGIYSNAANSIIFYTSSTTALTIDASQFLYGNGTRITNIGYANITKRPTNFQSDWNSTIINKREITIFFQTFFQFFGKIKFLCPKP